LNRKGAKAAEGRKEDFSRKKAKKSAKNRNPWLKRVSINGGHEIPRKIKAPQERLDSTLGCRPTEFHAFHI
jgi:hypothetical protein